MTIPIEHHALSLLWALATAGIAAYVLSVAQQVTYVTLADGRQQERAIPLLFRLMLPLVHNVLPLTRKKFLARTRGVTQGKLVSAGYEGLMNADELLAMRVLLPAVVGPFWCAIVIFGLGSIPGRLGASLDKNQLVFCVMGLLVLHLYPVTWLRRVLQARHVSLQRSLPFVLDLLTLSVEAGMDFMTALQRTVQQQRVLSPLGEELLRVIRQIQLGKTRKQALQSMITRVSHPDITAVFSSLIQADELGVSIGSILRIQSNQVRSKRFDRAEKMANEAPVKMLFPLMFFIFPSVFLILLGPVIMKLANQGGF